MYTCSVYEANLLRFMCMCVIKMKTKTKKIKRKSNRIGTQCGDTNQNSFYEKWPNELVLGGKTVAAKDIFGVALVRLCNLIAQFFYTGEMIKTNYEI